MLEKKWNHKKYGNKLLNKIIKRCNLPFGKPILDNGLTITIFRYKRKSHGELLGLLDIDNPSRISIYSRKKSSLKKLISTLCHELIHSLIWSNSFDKRRRSVSFFADIFADELIATLFEEAIMKRNIRKIDFRGALDYACKETALTLKNLKRKNDYTEVLKEVKRFLSKSKKAIRNGSDALKERDRVLTDITSPKLA